MFISMQHLLLHLLKLYSNVCEGKDGAVEKYLDLLKSGGNNQSY